MSKFEAYNINLKEIADETKIIDFVLDEAYFKKIDSPEVQKGVVNAKVSVKKKQSLYELSFVVEGTIIIPCNRCLDDMSQQINHKEKLQVKFGETFSEENEIVIVPESDGGINVAWFLYEFIALSIPIKHVHAPGECNVTMVSKLKKHITRQNNDEEDDDHSHLEFDDGADDVSFNEKPSDPRWDALQNISDNN